MHKVISFHASSLIVKMSYFALHTCTGDTEFRCWPNFLWQSILLYRCQVQTLPLKPHFMSLLLWHLVKAHVLFLFNVIWMVCSVVLCYGLLNKCLSRFVAFYLSLSNCVMDDQLTTMSSPTKDVAFRVLL